MPANDNAPIETKKTNEAPKMRKVRNHNIRSNNPGVMFAAGFESIVRDQLHQPAKFDEEELKVMERKAHNKPQPESLFSVFCRQLFWKKLA